jgi:benzoyl-CoA reductase subunit C
MAQIDELLTIAQNPYDKLARWKAATGKKIIGLTPMHFPEEIIHACGMLPVEMWTSNELITEGHAHVTPYYCGLTRSVIDDALKGKLFFMDGVVCYETCIQARTLPLILERNWNPPFLQAVFLPNQLANPFARSYLIETLELFKTRLEEFAGYKITREALENSIAVYNENRRLLSTIHDLRRERPGLLTLKEMTGIVQSGMIMPKEDHNRILEKLIPELHQRQPPAADPGDLMILAGSLCNAPSAEIINLIDESGIKIVDDDMYIGAKYFANQAKTAVAPIEALADRFLERTPPCPTKVDPETNLGDYLIDMVNRTGARGIVTFIHKYCPPHMCYSPDVKRKLALANVPELILEIEHEVVSLEQMRTRLQAFKESLRGA